MEPMRIPSTDSSLLSMAANEKNKRRCHKLHNITTPQRRVSPCNQFPNSLQTCSRLSTIFLRPLLLPADLMCQCWQINSKPQNIFTKKHRRTNPSTKWTQIKTCTKRQCKPKSPSTLARTGDVNASMSYECAQLLYTSDVRTAYMYAGRHR